MVNLLQNVRNTLGHIEVKGEQNLDMLLGCMRAIDQVIRDLQKPARPDGEDQPEE